MGLLEKASNIEAEEKLPETKVVKPKKEAVKEPPAKKPKKAAKKLTKIAPYKPALGPRPELTPKARAKGSATIPAVNPPKKSPLKLEKSNLNLLICD